jgi:phage-related protein
LEGEIKSPPFSDEARLEAGELLASLQAGESFGVPHSRPMPGIGQRVGELRIRDQNHNWRIIYRTDETAVLFVDVFDKKTQNTPKAIIENCKARLRRYDDGN